MNTSYSLPLSNSLILTEQEDQPPLSFSSLPEDIIKEIFSYLAHDLSIIRQLSSVSKLFHRLTQSMTYLPYGEAVLKIKFLIFRTLTMDTTDKINKNYIHRLLSYYNPENKNLIYKQPIKHTHILNIPNIINTFKKFWKKNNDFSKMDINLSLNEKINKSDKVFLELNYFLLDLPEEILNIHYKRALKEKFFQECNYLISSSSPFLKNKLTGIFKSEEILNIYIPRSLFERDNFLQIIKDLEPKLMMGILRFFSYQPIQSKVSPFLEMRNVLERILLLTIVTQNFHMTDKDADAIADLILSHPGFNRLTLIDETKITSIGLGKIAAALAQRQYNFYFKLIGYTDNVLEGISNLKQTEQRSKLIKVSITKEFSESQEIKNMLKEKFNID